MLSLYYAESLTEYPFTRFRLGNRHGQSINHT